MSNMSYCRFQNTLQDLKDCYNNIDETKELSREEFYARKQLIELCKDIAEQFDNEEYIDEEYDDQDSKYDVDEDDY